MTLTRQYYQVIADIIHGTKYLDVAAVQPADLRPLLASYFAEEFAKRNPRFDRSIFMKACGEEE